MRIQLQRRFPTFRFSHVERGSIRVTFYSARAAASCNSQVDSPPLLRCRCRQKLGILPGTTPKHAVACAARVERRDPCQSRESRIESSREAAAVAARLAASKLDNLY